MKEAASDMVRVHVTGDAIVKKVPLTILLIYLSAKIMPNAAAQQAARDG
jgi:hypothetical protein